MQQDPYKPPDSNPNLPAPKPANSLGWRVFCWLNGLLMTLAIVALPQMPALTLLDTVDLAVSIVATVGLYGFAYYRPIQTALFWRYFFYLALFEALGYSVLLPLVGVQRYGQEPAFDGFYLFEIGYAVLVLCALNMYAYKRPFIWRKN